MNHYTFEFCTKDKDERSITDFLYSLKDELYLPDRQTAQAITNLVFEKGGVIAGYHESHLCAMLGYFRGEPDHGYVNKDIAFLYVAGIAKPYRLTRLFRHGLVFTVHGLQEARVREIRLQAEAVNAYTNRLYARFARPLSEDKNLRGIPVITYGSSIEEALAYLERRKRPQPMLLKKNFS